jgi:hypothetical protein
VRFFCLLSAVVLGGVVLAQPQPAPSALPPTLKLFVLQGADVVNDISGHTAPVAPVVEVRDSNDQPVEGAQVIFELPASGPGGSFPGNKITYTTRTGVQGQASAPFTPNPIPGRFTIHVTATSADRFGSVTIRQTNGTVLPGASDRAPRTFNRKKWLIIGAAGAAAIAVGVVFATRGSTSHPTIAITPGPPVFGAP